MELKNRHIASLILLAIILLSFVLFNLYDGNNKVELKSSAFSNNEEIPSKYTCDGEDITPPLEISNVPDGAKSLVLIMDDPDAKKVAGKTWVHWVVWDIPPDIDSIEENTSLAGALHGVNDFGKNEYGGPCPPSGIHRYIFKLYALDNFLNLSKSSTKQDVESAMKGHITGEAKLTGLYSRQ